MAEEKYLFDWVASVSRLCRAVEIPKEKIFTFVVFFARHNREVVEAILRALDLEESRKAEAKKLAAKHKKRYRYTKIGCPFPFSCCNFPCDDLVCDADSLGPGGAPFRRS